jgi:hypothetical protein
VSLSLESTRDIVIALAERFAQGNYLDYRMVRQWTNGENGTITVEVEARFTTAQFRAITIIYEDNLKRTPVRVLDYTAQGW